MHGDGINPAITTADPSARLIELTRVLALKGRPPTGVDRVCLAYLRAVVSDVVPAWGLARTKAGYVLVNKEGMNALLARLEGRTPWGESDWISRVTRDAENPRRETEADLRRLRTARCTRSFLGRMLRRYLPSGTVYINVDHANFSQRVVNAVKSIPHGKISVFLHDTIPLDLPDFEASKPSLEFARLFERARRNADVLIVNSEVTRQDVIRHMSRAGDVPEIVVAHLGVEGDLFQIVNNQPNLVSAPYFVAVGTISPRKNHGFLLDIWDRMAKEQTAESLPHLVIAGRRGWKSDELFARLGNSPLRGVCVHEFNSLDDAALGHLVAGASGLVFPSIAEGFGLPPVEAAAAGVPVVCNDLPVMREILGEYPIYASVTDSYSWIQAIRTLAQADRDVQDANGRPQARFEVPTWEAHFNTVLRVT
ncbi:glycosyltransferase family 4 protein [Shimia haliotis]|uniref:Glycosyltransferase involved in cell wall bisynthesis n=1 Tax=Shimia haliotis TaxID=1280847 RepID=A0A1I4ELI6_9RHOB|nr:glycosyltransferase family 1 protein [Shimia haliotis]SFL06574.1 Glycosyltransferase involved in cell wall bisynthesis [Shimia haliotis]